MKLGVDQVSCKLSSSLDSLQDQNLNRTSALSWSVTEAHEQLCQTGKLKAHFFNQNYSAEKQPQTEFIQNHSTL